MHILYTRTHRLFFFSNRVHTHFANLFKQLERVQTYTRDAVKNDRNGRDHVWSSIFYSIISQNWFSPQMSQ